MRGNDPHSNAATAAALLVPHEAAVLLLRVKEAAEATAAAVPQHQAVSQPRATSQHRAVARRPRPTTARTAPQRLSHEDRPWEAPADGDLYAAVSMSIVA